MPTNSFKGTLRSRPLFFVVVRVQWFYMIRNTIRELIEKALKAQNIEGAHFTVEHPDELSHGDYSTNAAMVYGKQLKVSPKELAGKLVEYLEANKVPAIVKIEIAGPGFINFHLSNNFFTTSVGEIISQDKSFGNSTTGKGRKVLVEFSSPNIAKPFSIGHLRSTVIGDAVARILGAVGYKVIRDNHLGDWGTQFGKMISAIKRWGDENMIAKSENPVKDLVALYVKFHEEAEKDPKLEDEGREWFAKLEQGDAEAKRLWKKCIDWSLVEFKKIYKKLGVAFDTELGESFFEDKMSQVLKELEERNLLKKSEGAELVFFEGDKYPPLMIKKSDGSTLYATRDLAADKYRLETYGNDITIVNEVGIEQSLYFKQLLEVEKRLGWIKDGQRVHVSHGLYRFKDGKMSTRKGNVIWLEDILSEAITRASEINKDTAEAVGIGAIKFNDLKREAKQDILFNWEEVVNLKGDSGPYLQYSYARARSILEKGRIEGIVTTAKAELPKDTSELEKLLYRFPEVVERAGKEYSPHLIATYLIMVAASFNNYYAKNKIVDAKDPISPYKLALTEAFSVVLKNGLNLLGIEAPEKM
jgi:arginyl-tRNA synthetase